MTASLVGAIGIHCPFTNAMLLADPVARLAWADWLEEHGQPRSAVPWRALAPLHLSPWTVENLETHLTRANRHTEQRSPRDTGRDRRLELMDCLLVALEAHREAAEVGCCCVHGGGVCFGWRRGYTTVCLAVRKADGTVAVDVGSARARVGGGSPANIWRDLVQYRPERSSCRARLKAWAAVR
jgi:hypothetical protein